MEFMEDKESQDKAEESYIDDLQLAAKLGKKLLERNRDLEETLNQQEEIIDDYYNEIKFLSQQSKSLKDVSESRLLIYEQLEVTVLELEKTNQKLLNESHADKIRIKSLQELICSLELKCEELQRVIHLQKEMETRIKKEISKTVNTFLKAESAGQINRIIEGSPPVCYSPESMELAKLKGKIAKLSSQLCREQRRFDALEAQTVLVLEESLSLKEQVQTLQAQKEKSDFFQENQRICLVCRNTRSQDTLSDSRRFSITYSEQGISLDAEIESIRLLNNNKSLRRSSSNTSFKCASLTDYSTINTPNTESIKSMNSNCKGQMKSEDYYDSGCEDLSLTSNASFCLNSLDFETQSLNPKSLYDELLEVDDDISIKLQFTNESFETFERWTQTEASLLQLTSRANSQKKWQTRNQYVQTDLVEVGNKTLLCEGVQPNDNFSGPPKIKYGLTEFTETNKSLSLQVTPWPNEVRVTNVDAKDCKCELVNDIEQNVVAPSIQMETECLKISCNQEQAIKSKSKCGCKREIQVETQESVTPELHDNVKLTKSVPELSFLKNVNAAIQCPSFFAATPTFTPSRKTINTQSEPLSPEPVPRIRKKRYKSFLLRTPFFSIPSKTLFSGPLLKIGFPFAATQAQVLSNAFKYCS